MVSNMNLNDTKAFMFDLMAFLLDYEGSMPGFGARGN